MQGLSNHGNGNDGVTVDDLRVRNCVYIISESNQLGSYRKPMQRSFSGIYEKNKANPERILLENTFDSNQNNNGTNSTENWEEHLEELTPITEPVPDLRIVRTRNYERFSKLATAATKQRNAREDDEPTKNTKSEGKIQVRGCTRKRKHSIGKTVSAPTTSASKLKQEFALLPLNYGRYGELMQRGPGGKPKYTDVASIIEQGTVAHSVSPFQTCYIQCISDRPMWGHLVKSISFQLFSLLVESFLFFFLFFFFVLHFVCQIHLQTVESTDGQ